MDLNDNNKGIACGNDTVSSNAPVPYIDLTQDDDDDANNAQSSGTRGGTASSQIGRTDPKKGRPGHRVHPSRIQHNHENDLLIARRASHPRSRSRSKSPLSPSSRLQRSEGLRESPSFHYHHNTLPPRITNSSVSPSSARVEASTWTANDLSSSLDVSLDHSSWSTKFPDKGQQEQHALMPGSELPSDHDWTALETILSSPGTSDPTWTPTQDVQGVVEETTEDPKVEYTEEEVKSFIDFVKVERPDIFTSTKQDKNSHPQEIWNNNDFNVGANAVCERTDGQEWMTDVDNLTFQGPSNQGYSDLSTDPNWNFEVHNDMNTAMNQNTNSNPSEITYGLQLTDKQVKEATKSQVRNYIKAALNSRG